MSSLPVKTVVPSGLKATAMTRPWCRNGEPNSLPSAVVHNRAFMSSLPVTIDRPSGLKATA